ncbi:MAG: type III PLP-dependent enzyme [Burkholderiaceae bacterium]
MNDATRATRTVEPSLAERLIEQQFERAGGELLVDGHRVGDLLDCFGSPLFVYRAQTMRDAVRDLRRATHGRFDIHYSIKANPNPAVIALMAGEGAGAEVASAAEYECARRAGIAPQRILFAGPAKSAAELAHVLERGIGEIHVESDQEIERLAGLTRRLGLSARVSVRVNPDSAAQGGSMRMGGRPTQFGFDEESIDEVAMLLDSTPGLTLVGVHMFAGTQILDADTLLGQWRHGLAVAARIGALIGRPLATVDLGGGLGIPIFKSDRPLDLERLHAGLVELLAGLDDDPFLSQARLIIEPGRFLAGPAGIYLARVNALKRSKGETFIVTDGGMHHHLAASGNLGQVLKKDYPLVLANRLDDADRHPATVCGPLCTPLDVIGRQAALPRAQVNDIVAVLQSGAYALSASPVGFLSHPMPAELLVDGRELRVIRRRGSFEHPITEPEPP